MLIDGFEELHNKMTVREAKTLDFKRVEYARGDEDTLVNFKQTADFLGIRPEEVCLIYLMKHIQSVSLAVQRDVIPKFEWQDADGHEGLAQRFTDARNFLVLLAALIQEREENGST